MPDNTSRIEPIKLENAPVEIANLVAELASASATLGAALSPATASNLAALVRIMNTYYSNLIEGHDTKPRDIERALEGDFEEATDRRNLQLEAAAHIRVQAELDRLAGEGILPEPASRAFIQWLHREFYRDAPTDLLTIGSGNQQFIMHPGEWRSKLHHDVVVGRHIPPASETVPHFMEYFENRFDFSKIGKADKIMAIASAHHRFNYIHPFPDGNGRVSRLLSHAMALHAGIGAHGLWSISRGLARGLNSRSEYKSMMDYADSPRQGDLDGRGNLSQKALTEFSIWFLKVSLDQVTFMTDLFDINNLEKRLSNYVDRSETLKPSSLRLLQEALTRGQFERGSASRLTGFPERTARRVLNETIEEGLLASSTPKGAVSLRFPISTLETLFPKLYAEK